MLLHSACKVPQNATSLLLSTLVTALCSVSCIGAAKPSPDAVSAEISSENQEDSVSLTIYSSADPASFDPQRFIAQQRAGYNPNFAWQVPGFAVVRDTRSMQFKAGLNEIRFTDVAQFIDPTTVSFTDLTDGAGTSVIGQVFEFDLISQQKLFEKYIDRTIGLSVERDGNTLQTTGKVLAVTGGMFILETEAGIEFLTQGSQRITLPPLPIDDLVTKPTLKWKLQASKGGEHRIRTAYQTDGVTWRADYNLVLHEGDLSADLGAWVTLMNLSGTAFPNAQLKLIAGDVQRIQPQQAYAPYSGRGVAGAMDRMDAGFEQKSFFEYHLYTLPYRTDVMNNSTQQITLFPTVQEIAVDKVLVYYGLPESRHWYGGSPQTDRNLGSQSNAKVDVYIQFENEEDNKLGKPMPAGKVRVYKLDEADGSLEFIGEDLIDHTPRNEQVLIKVGQAFDVVGDRTQTDFQIDTRNRRMTESIEIKLRNHKDEAIQVIVRENLYRWVNWELTQQDLPFEKIDSRTVHFTVSLEPDEERIIRYTVLYTW